MIRFHEATILTTVLALLMPFSFPCDILLHEMNGSKSVTSIHFQHRWLQLQQLLEATAADNRSLNFIFTDAPHFLHLRPLNDVFQVVVCTSWLCHHTCQLCTSDSAIVPASNAAAAAKALHRLKVSRVIVLFDDSVSTLEWNITGFLSILSANRITHVTFDVDLRRLSSLRARLHALIPGYRHFVVFCRQATTLILMKAAARMDPNRGLLNRQFFWIVAAPVGDPERFLMQLPPFANVMRLRSSQATCGPVRANRTQVLAIAQRIAAMCDTCSPRCAAKILRELQNCSSNASRVDLMTSYTRETQLAIVTRWKKTGTYSAATNVLDKGDAPLFPNTFVDFGGRTLVVATIGNKPFVISTGRNYTFENYTCHVVEGATIDTIRIISQKLNFTPCYVYPPDGEYGDYNESSGEATGLIGMVFRQKVIMAAAGLTISLSRAKAVDFTFPYTGYSV